MLKAVLSDDLPRSRVLTIILLVILFGLCLAPFLFPGTRPVDTAARICVFIVLVASYDLMLGYTGIVSFAHTMFYGIGAYGVAILSKSMGPGFTPIILGTLVGLAISVTIAFLVAMFSLRVKAIFFAMVTLAIGSAFTILVSQQYGLTGGEDGLIYKIPKLFSPATKFVDDKIFGVRINGKLMLYYIVFFAALAMLLILLRIVNSPFGRVLKAVRENEFRAEAIGFRTVTYRTIAVCLSAGFASLAGSLLAIWLKYTGPDTFLASSIMLDILLMVVIGGMGTMYGAAIGATLFILAQTYLQNLMQIASKATESIPLLTDLVHPDRWLWWLGVFFILSVYFFPTGVVGRLRRED